MVVRHRTWRSSSMLAAAFALLGESRRHRPADTSVPLELAHALRLPTGDAEPGEDVLLGLKTPVSLADDERLVVWERRESAGDRHTVYLRGDVVSTRRNAHRDASIVLRPNEPGHYQVIDDGSGHVLHHFQVTAQALP